MCGSLVFLLYLVLALALICFTMLVGVFLVLRSFLLLLRLIHQTFIQDESFRFLWGLVLLGQVVFEFLDGESLAVSGALESGLGRE